LVGGPAAGPDPSANMRRLGYSCVELDDPYAAMAVLAAQPLAYSCLVLSLNTFFRGELQLIRAVKHRFPHIEVWITRFEGRQQSVDEAMKLGADGFLDADGLHRLSAVLPEKPAAATAAPAASTPPPASESPIIEPVLTAEELRALLDDPPPSGNGAAV
jgi:DNA-binding NarL/FixJ family response regulator